MNEYGDNGIEPALHDDLPVPHEFASNAAKHRAILFMAFINVGKLPRRKSQTRSQFLTSNQPLFPAVAIALGSLTIWHLKLIRRGETSIEAHINKSETRRLNALGKQYVNPYDFGARRNLNTFLGLVRGRTVWRHLLLPSRHRPFNDGLSWPSVHSATAIS